MNNDTVTLTMTKRQASSLHAVLYSCISGLGQVRDDLDEIEAALEDITLGSKIDFSNTDYDTRADLNLSRFVVVSSPEYTSNQVSTTSAIVGSDEHHIY